MYGNILFIDSYKCNLATDNISYSQHDGVFYLQRILFGELALLWSMYSRIMHLITFIWEWDDQDAPFSWQIIITTAFYVITEPIDWPIMSLLGSINPRCWRSTSRDPDSALEGVKETIIVLTLGMPTLSNLTL